MSNIAAGIGRGQMTVIDERVQRRRAIHDYYQNQLGVLPGFSFLPEPTGHFSNRWLTTVLIDETKTAVSPEAIRLLLEQENIESRPLWKPLHAQPVFADAPAFLNGTADQLFARGICLPSGTALTESQLEYICSLIKNKAHAK
jgi:dTDP-4-amino-4,6-dideoxygalactose transaminase